MAAPARHHRRAGLGCTFRASRLPDRVRERLKIVGPRLRFGESRRGPDHIPAAWRRQAGCVVGAQIVGMRLRGPRQRPDHGGAVRVGERQRRNGRMGAPGPGASAHTCHGPERSPRVAGRAGGAPIRATGE